jgi:hypothetical protein
MTGFPIQPEQLTAEWFTTMLADAGALAPGDAVTSFSTDFIGDGLGLLGMVIRVHLEYANGSGGGPESVVIKFAHPVPENRAIATNLNMYEREVRFFNDIAHEVDVPKPECYFAGMDYDAKANIVVLEDLKRYRAGDQVAGISADEAKMVIDAIVPLHSAYWGKTDSEPLAWMMRVDSTYIEPFMPGVEGTWQNAVQQFGYCITDDVKEALPRYIAGLRELHRVMGRRTQTLIHGDVRMDNAMFGDGKPGLEPVVMVDWQAIMVSNPMQDIAWMLSTCLPTPVRREHEDELVAYYHQKMVDAGCAGYTLEQCIDDYEVGVLYLLSYPLIIAGAFDPANERGKGLAEEGLRRSSQTITDRGILSRIPG